MSGPSTHDPLEARFFQWVTVFAFCQVFRGFVCLLMMKGLGASLPFGKGRLLAADMARSSFSSTRGEKKTRKSGASLVFCNRMANYLGCGVIAAMRDSTASTPRRTALHACRSSRRSVTALPAIAPTAPKNPTPATFMAGMKAAFPTAVRATPVPTPLTDKPDHGQNLSSNFEAGSPNSV
jgi:hypothetical protein